MATRRKTARRSPTRRQRYDTARRVYKGNTRLRTGRKHKAITFLKYAGAIQVAGIATVPGRIRARRRGKLGAGNLAATYALGIGGMYAYRNRKRIKQAYKSYKSGRAPAKRRRSK
jgi:hypothetical protein